ncbi:hypothetical protein [Dongia rigui]|uniref:Lipoprotein n=1 Tax=Dongia rigui TaxID=940149 RepID=A0ABU5E1R2_9PROT|nr:hypothetical protein [Dongia rigui]MDY0873140.1 hypothetical protein [Dongia rigui]
MKPFLISFLLLLTACASQAMPKNDADLVGQPSTMTSAEARAVSGLDAEYVVLYERLNQVCKLPPERPFGLTPDQMDCVVSRTVSAFGAEAGESGCRAQLEQGTFIGCIVDGTLLTLVAKNAGSADIPWELFWSDQLGAWERLNAVLNENATKHCKSASQSDAAACQDDYVLRLFEIDRTAVAGCPTGWAREDCVSGVATVKLIRSKLPYLF